MNDEKSSFMDQLNLFLVGLIIGAFNLDLMDTDLATDYGADYLDAKSKVDNLIDK